MSRLRCCIVILAIVTSWQFAYAETPDNVRGTWFFSVDNDILAKSDDDYTNGIQLGWVSGYLDKYRDGPVFEFVGKHLDTIQFLAGSHRQRFISHSFSHRIFTPGDTLTTEPIEGDLPYTGLLFATFTAGAQDSEKMDAISFHYGIVGPSAQGKQVQNEFHKLIGSDPVNGWDNQIGDELILNINYEHRRRLSTFRFNNGVNGDFIGQAGVGVGNLITMATVGIGARIGWGVSDDYGIPPQFFGEETIGSRPYTQSNNGDGFWFFTLLNTSAFANAIFWDGNTFKDSMSVDHDPYIGRFYVGMIARVGNISASFAIAKTTVPWDNPDNKSIQTYGRFRLTYSYY